jgi:undecaprenyl-diphosphatase
MAADEEALQEPESAPAPEISSGPSAARRTRLYWARAALRRAQLLYARWTFLLACAVLAIGGFIKLTAELASGELDAFDRMALQQIVKMRVPGLNGPAVDLTALGSVGVLTLLCVLTVTLLLMHRDRIAALQLIIAASGGGVISTLLKRVLERARPAEVEKLVAVSSFSYPSGHSLASASVYLTLAIVIARRLDQKSARVFVFSSALLLMTGIGLSRAYLGVHFPSDIAAGLLLGSGWSLLVSSLFSYILAQRA